jgi:hypothetical protein
MKGSNIMRNNSKKPTRPLFAANFQKEHWPVERSPSITIPESWVSPKQKAIDESHIRALAAGLLIQKHSQDEGGMIAIDYYANSRPCLEIQTNQDGSSEVRVAPSRITREQAIAEVSALAIAESGVHTAAVLPLAIAEASSIAA